MKIHVDAIAEVAWGKLDEVQEADPPEIPALIYRGTIKGEDRRWSRTDVVLFSLADSPEDVWGAYYEQGLTENQDCDGFRDHADRTTGLIECTRWRPVTRTIKDWEPIP